MRNGLGKQTGAMANVTAAFLSYVREVDAFGDVTRFRDALEKSVRERSWKDFAIFDDGKDVGLVYGRE